MMKILTLCILLTLPAITALTGCTSLSEENDTEGDVSAEEYGPYVSRGLNREAIHDENVLQAMSRVPRHNFVPKRYSGLAYDDRALPIGSGQTISQPFIVALMSQEANITLGSRVLEIGTGSGYQAAVLAELGARVYSIEILDDLAKQAAKRLSQMGYKTVSVKQGDGWNGWPEEAPFDAILVTAAAPKPPAKLMAQLANRGRLIVPIEDADGRGETLMVFEKDGADLISRQLGGVRFVPLTGIAREDISVIEELEKAAEKK